MEYESTGGWALTERFTPTGQRSLCCDEGSIEIVYNDNPLTPEQMRALAARLTGEADAMEAQA